LRYLAFILVPAVAAAVLDVVIAFHGATPTPGMAGSKAPDVYTVTVKDNAGRDVHVAFAGSTGRALILAEKVIGKERTSRFVGWLDPETMQSADGYQLWHSYLALGSGGYGGLGFTESRMKQRYLPEAHTDFIMSIVGEELGCVTLFLVVLVYASLTILAFTIGAQATDREGSLICAGTAVSLGLHALVNLGVASGLLPTTGVTAPFVSYGGSNIVASWLGAGLLFSVSRTANRRAQLEEAEPGTEASRQAVPLERIFT
jgi:cell division protein FtsW (lipid II flippase)